MKSKFLWTSLFCLSMAACSSSQVDDQTGAEPMEMVSDVSDHDLESQLDKSNAKSTPTTAAPVETVQEDVPPPTTIPVPTQTEEPAPVMSHGKEPPIPQVSEFHKAKKADLKFKWKNDTVSAKVSLKEDKKSVDVKISGLNFKKGLYTLMVLDSCKKTAKGKPKKLVSFNVKKTGKFSDSTSAKSTKFSSLKGKSIGLFFGPKTKTRLDCETVK